MASLVLKLTGDDNHKLRGMLAPNGMQVFSVYDFMTVACCKNDKGAFARKWYGENIKDEGSGFHAEFADHTHSLKFPGNYIQCCENFHNL